MGCVYRVKRQNIGDPDSFAVQNRYLGQPPRREYAIVARDGRPDQVESRYLECSQPQIHDEKTTKGFISSMCVSWM